MPMQTLYNDVGIAVPDDLPGQPGAGGDEEIGRPLTPAEEGLKVSLYC